MYFFIYPLNTEERSCACYKVLVHQDRSRIWRVGSVDGGKPENLEKNPWNKDDDKQQIVTQPTYDAGFRVYTRVTLVGGKRCHHSAPLLFHYTAYADLHE